MYAVIIRHAGRAVSFAAISEPGSRVMLIVLFTSDCVSIYRAACINNILSSGKSSMSI